MLLPSIYNSLDDLKSLLNQLSDQQFTKECKDLSNATIGEHTRHIIEMFQCLVESYDAGIICYDNRQRNIIIQSSCREAFAAISRLQEHLDKSNKTLTLSQMIDNENITITSNYFRELLYNFEHCIHHQALIKVAVLQCGNISVDENFGVARSTIEYRKQCAQ